MTGNVMNTNKSNTLSVLCVLAAGLLWGCMGILVRTMNEGGFNSLEVTAFRSFVTAIIMLAVLTMNPEMADFVRGYGDPDREAVSGGLTEQEQEQEQEFPLLLQWDPRWGYVEYGDDSCIGLSGCGPTCLSMVLYYLTGDKALTPEVIGQYSMENDYYMWGTGTKWALLEDVAVLYGITVSQPDTSLEEMKSALEEDKLIICSMGPGEFTTAGHFIVIYGYKDGEFCINDPNCVARSRRTWSYEEIADQIKHLWIFEK